MLNVLVIADRPAPGVLPSVRSGPHPGRREGTADQTGDPVADLLQTGGPGGALTITEAVPLEAGHESLAALPGAEPAPDVILLILAPGRDPLTSLVLDTLRAAATHGAVLVLIGRRWSHQARVLLANGADDVLVTETLTTPGLARAIRFVAFRAAMDRIDAGTRATTARVEDLAALMRRTAGLLREEAADLIPPPSAETIARHRDHLLTLATDLDHHAGPPLAQAPGPQGADRPTAGAPATARPPTLPLARDLGSRLMINLIPDFACLVRDDTVILVNAIGAALIGKPAADLIGRRLGDLLRTDPPTLVAARMLDLAIGRQEHAATIARPDGSPIPVGVTVAPFGSRHPDLAGCLLVVARDRSAEDAATREAQRQGRFLKAVAETMIDALLVTDDRGRIEAFNPAAERMFGWAAADMLGHSINRLIPDTHAAHHDGYIRALLARHEDGTFQGMEREVQARHRSGTAFPVELSLSLVTIDGHSRFVAIARDITERKDYENRLLTIATRDPLTGLPNRVLLRERLEEAATRARQDQGRFAVLFVDLDHFKKINDSMGHSLGDRVISAMGRRLQAHVIEEQGDMLAHLGGDEFSLVLGSVADRDEVEARATALLDDLVRPYDLAGREIFTTTTIGIALFPDDGRDIPALLRNVDTAVHHAKRHQRSRAIFYSEQLSAEVVRRLHIETGLRRALERAEFDLHYQPKVDLVTGTVIGAEALLRWDGRDIGKVSPAEFVPVAEETGLVLPIGEWVLRRACIQARIWRDKGLPPIRMGVNLSAQQFRDPDLAVKVGSIITETGMDPHMLDLELTESMLVEDGDQAVSVLRRLKTLGLTLSIDDFGTGYSSLGYLKRFPIDFLKIDRSFIQDLPRNVDDMAITRAIASMAQALRLALVAEGVETQEQRAFLSDLGCAQGQGYYFSRPVPADAFEALLLGQLSPGEPVPRDSLVAAIAPIGQARS